MTHQDLDEDIHFIENSTIDLVLGGHDHEPTVSQVCVPSLLLLHPSRRFWNLGDDQAKQALQLVRFNPLFSGTIWLENPPGSLKLVKIYHMLVLSPLPSREIKNSLSISNESSLRNMGKFTSSLLLLSL